MDNGIAKVVRLTRLTQINDILRFFLVSNRLHRSTDDSLLAIETAR